MRRGSPLTR